MELVFIVDLEKLIYVLCFFQRSIVSVGDPKENYTRFEKIGQGVVNLCIS